MLFQAADKLVAISCLSCEGEVQKHNIFLTEHISLVCAICKNRQNATEALSCHGMTYQVTSTHTKILSKPLSALFKCPSLLGDKKVNCTAATYFSNSSKKPCRNKNDFKLCTHLRKCRLSLNFGPFPYLICNS